MAKSPVNEFARYIKADATYKHRIIAASYGEVGTGKTSFWLGAPGPIVVQTLDQGLEGVVERFTADKEIYIATYDIGQEVGGEYTQELAIAACDKFVEDYEHALRTARTIVWDRETDMFQMFSYAANGTTDAYGAATPKDWDKLKGRIRRMIAMAKASDVNFGMIQGMKNEWAKAGAKMGQTGNRVRSGMDDIDALAHVNIEHTRDNGIFGINVGKSRGPGSMDIQDKSFQGVSFVEFAQLVFPDSTEESWL